MSEIRIASRYAKSLLELAEEKGLVEEIFKDMDLFSNVIENNREFLLVLKNPIISSDKKLAILKALFENKVNSLSMSFFSLITKKNREVYLPEVAEQFISQYNEYIGNIAATVTTTFPLTDDLRVQFKNIIRQYTGKEAHLKEYVNPNLIGGFVLKMGDRQLDESIRSKLEELKTNLIEKSYIRAF
jgi:F-type H+-transporting ATPase subunit delta